jgi:hypothetical protein
MTPEQAELVDRLRALLAAESSTREVPMFGGLSFMVNDKLIVSALRGGDLLVRVAPERDSELGDLPGASPAEMGPGRTMRPGWISVSAAAITGDDRLAFWLAVTLEHNRAMARDR